MIFNHGRILAVTVFAVCVFWATFVGASAKNGDSLFNEGKYISALAEYEKAIEREPRNAVAYLGRAKIRFMAEQDALALADANKAIELNPDLAPAYEFRAWVLCDSKDYEDAISDMDRAIALQPEDVTLYISRGEIYREQGDSTQGFADLEKGQESPHSSEKINEISLFGRMLIYGDKEDAAKELARYTEILEINPEAERTRYKRGQCYLEREEYEKAAADFTKAIELNPNKAEYYENRAWCYRNLNCNEEAETDMERAGVIRATE